jgi:hypothetical protein
MAAACANKARDADLPGETCLGLVPTMPLFSIILDPALKLLPK